ncbi:hypothetical protein JKP88DRAFT_350023 [Tribonema minus]|uniref:Uncharacterized protein n=1 Tax=Tribonema minus TaxID=303371 RepID=A0A835YTD0_9STRA|nr:hypothetical protein JKP88DRAFT_350023 [Tribonema minus]
MKHIKRPSGRQLRDYQSQESKVQYDCIGTESCRSTRFGDKTSARCLVKNACQDAIFRKGSIGNCETPYACLGATFLRKGKLVRCHVERGCQSVYINEGREALCKVKNACVYFSIGRGSKATCTRPGACQATKFLTDEGPEIKCSGDGSCKELIVFCGGTKNQNGAKFTGGACCYGSGCPKDAPLCTGRACPANSGPECA